LVAGPLGEKEKERPSPCLHTITWHDFLSVVQTTYTKALEATSTLTNPLAHLSKVAADKPPET